MGYTESSRVCWGISLPILQAFEQLRKLEKEIGLKKYEEAVQVLLRAHIDDENNTENNIWNEVTENLEGEEECEAEINSIVKCLDEKVPDGRWKKWTLLLPVEGVMNICRGGYNRCEDSPNYASVPASKIKIPTSFPDFPFTGDIVLIQSISSG